MADKRIDELEEAVSVTATDLFVLEQASTAKKLTGQTMTNFLLQLANGHGGISSITKTGSAGTNPVIDTYTVTLADGTTQTFQVTNGAKGDTGATGPRGPAGEDITITSTSVAYQEWASGTMYPTGTWVDNPPNVSQGNFLWTRTIVNYSDGGQTVSYSVARQGVDGSGSVSTVNNVSPDSNGNIQLSASDIGALPSSYQAPVTSVNGKSGAVDLSALDVGAVRGQLVTKSISAAGWYRAVKFAAGSANDALGYIGAVLHLDITRGYSGTANEAHGIDLNLVANNIAFVGEQSVSNVHGIDKVRYNVNGSNGYVDIHYTMSNANPVTVCFSVSTDSTNQSKFTVETLQAVNDAPSGETVLATHDFVANTHISDSVSGSYGTIYYDRKGGVCSIYGDVNNVPTGAWTTLATGLPAPARTQFFIAQNGASTDFVMCQLNTSGTLKFYGRGSYSSGYPTWTYVCN